MTEPDDNKVQLDVQEVINNTLAVATSIITQLISEVAMLRTQLAQVVKDGNG